MNFISIMIKTISDEFAECVLDAFFYTKNKDHLIVTELVSCITNRLDNEIKNAKKGSERLQTLREIKSWFK